MAIPLAPIGPALLICLGCGEKMRLVIEKYKNGKVSRLVHYCDQCRYGHEPSMIHAPGQTVKYVPLDDSVLIETTDQVSVDAPVVEVSLGAKKDGASG
jgi:hypothetical protein